MFVCSSCSYINFCRQHVFKRTSQFKSFLIPPIPAHKSIVLYIIVPSYCFYSSFNNISTFADILFNLFTPESKHNPPVRFKHIIYFYVPLHVSFNFRNPEISSALISSLRRSQSYPCQNSLSQKTAIFYQ